jgi:hypothetical protein
VRTLHSYWAYVVIASNLGVGVWGLIQWRRKREARRSFWIALGVAWVSIYIQGALGLAMFERHKPPFKHHFYGFLFAIITLAVFPIRGEAPRRTLLVFSIATLFIGIVAVRATLSL